MSSTPATTFDNRPAILILGIGNILLGDEGVGVRFVEAMRGQVLPPNVELFDGGTSGAGLVDEIAGRRKLIVVDAMRSNAPPGTVLRLGAQDLLGNPDSLSLHEFGLSDTLMMAAHLGCMPDEIVIFGVQPKDIRVELNLSETVASILPDLMGIVLYEMRCAERVTEQAVPDNCTKCQDQCPSLR